MSLEQLNGLTCVLTGATGGIGRALSRVLTASGSRLVLAGRDQAALASLADALPPGSVIDQVPGDLTTSRAREDLAVRARRHSPDVLVNLCGVNDLCMLETQQPDAIADMLAANLHAPMELTRLLLPTLKRQPRALVVNVGSVFGRIGHPGYAAYCATKFGLRGFSEALRRELYDTGVRVVHVEPRATRTAMNEGPAATFNEALKSPVDPPEVVARRIARAMSRATPNTVIGLPERLYSHMNVFLPSIIDRSLGNRLETLRNVLRTTSTNL